MVDHVIYLSRFSMRLGIYACLSSFSPEKLFVLLGEDHSLMRKRQLRCSIISSLPTSLHGKL